MLRQRRSPTPVTWKGPKPRLTMTVIYECRVHYQDLEAYLAKVYRMNGYNVLMATGATNGLCPEFRVTGRLPPAHNIQQQVNSIRRGRRTRNLGMILNVLCMDGFIPVGKYVIDTHKKPDPIATYTNLLNETRDPDHPECVAFRKKHAKDREFQKRADTLERLARAFKEKD